MKIKVSEVVFRDDLYPRIRTNPVIVQQYAESLQHLPPIEVNQRNELIDGWHRWTAHKSANEQEIEVIVTETASDAELLKLAIIRNARHGQQLSPEDKRIMACRLYETRQATKDELISMLSVSRAIIFKWLARIDSLREEEEDRIILDGWFRCDTQEEIADSIGLPRRTVSDRIDSLGEKSKFGQSAKTSTLDEIPLYNVWAKAGKTNDVNHPGNSEPTWLDRLVYLYTDQGDIVIDPFAGSGSTIDVCRKRGRRYWVSDLNPIVARESEIRKMDITTEMPSLTKRWSDVKLVYLDPPYWRQALDMYGDSPSNLANMSLDDFHSTLLAIVNRFSEKAKNAAIALIIQPTQWNAPERKFTDHIQYMLKHVDMPVDMRIQAPYSTQQCTPQMVNWAKENKKILVISREIIVWKNA